MKGKTHVAFGLVATTYVVSNYTDYDLTPITYLPIVAFATFGSLLPDIDHENSKLGSKVPIIPKLLKHRGITHTVYSVIFTTFLISMFVYSMNLDSIYILSFFVGISCHLIGDILTKQGLSIFAIGRKFKFKLRIPIIRDDFIDSLFQYGFLLILPFTLL